MRSRMGRAALVGLVARGWCSRGGAAPTRTDRSRTRGARTVVARGECSLQPSASSSSKATGTPAPTALLARHGGGGRQWAAVSPLLSENPQGLTDTTWTVAGHLFTLARGSY